MTTWALVMAGVLLFAAGLFVGTVTMGAVTGDHCPGITTRPEEWPRDSDEPVGSWGWCQDAFDRAMENVTAI